MRTRIIIEFAGKPHVLKAVLLHLVVQALIPPCSRLLPIADFPASQGRFRKRIEPEPPAERLVDFGQEIKRADAREVAGIVAVQNGNVEGIRIEADKEICSLNNTPECGKLLFRVCPILVRFGIVDADDGEFQGVGVESPARKRHELRLDIERERSHDSFVPRISRAASSGRARISSRLERRFSAMVPSRSSCSPYAAK